MPAILELKLDLTGIDPDNLITNEQHANIDAFSKVIIPKHGNFFTEGLVITNALNEVLVRNTDFACIEFSQNESLQAGKEICAAIVILSDYSDTFTLTYQALGGVDSAKKKDITDAYDLINISNPPAAWSDIVNKPTMFKPTHHLHDVNEIYGFEYFVKELIKIRRAIQIGPIPSFQSLIGYIDSILKRYEEHQSDYLTNNLGIYISNFLATINKAYFDIDYLEDLTIAFERDGKKIGERSFKSSDLTLNKYITVETLVGLKHVIYSSFVLKQPTSLGFKEAQYGLPVLDTVIQMVNGSTVNLISQNKARAEGISSSDQLYPIDVEDSEEVVITKVSNNPANRGGVYIGFNALKEDIHLGALTSTGSADTIKWKRIITSDEVFKLLAVIDKHSVDYGNPHDETKELVGLGLVENLPVVSKEDLRAIKSVHKYLTFDALLYFMRTFLLQNGKQYAPTEATKNKFIVDNCVVVYTPAGITCKTQCDVAPAPQRNLTFSKINQTCALEGESIPIGGDGYSEEYITDISLIGEYNIGTGTNLIQAVKHFSQCCGYEENLMDVYLNMSNSQNWLSETGVGNLLPGSYFTIKLTYPGIQNGVIRVSGVYPDDNFFSFKTGKHLGTFNVEYSNRFYTTRTGTMTHVIDDEVPEEDQVTKIYLYMDRKYIKQGTVANAEFYMHRYSASSQTNYTLTWRKNNSWDPITIPGLPTTLTAVSGQQLLKLQFEIPYTPSLNGDSLVVTCEADGQETISNKLTFISQASTKVTKTLPLYIDNVSAGNIVISRETETGYISIEGIQIPTAQNTSDVYFLRKSGTDGNAPISAVVDVWNDYSDSDWEFPLLTNGNNPTLPPTTTNAPTTSTIPPSTTQTPTSTQVTSTQAPTTSTPSPTVNLEKQLTISLLGIPINQTIRETVITLKLTPAGQLSTIITGWINLEAPRSVMSINSATGALLLEVTYSNSTITAAYNYNIDGTFTTAQFNEMYTGSFIMERVGTPPPTSTSVGASRVWKVLLEKSKPRGGTYNPYQVYSNPGDTSQDPEIFTSQEWNSETDLLNFINSTYFDNPLTIANHSQITLAAAGWKAISYRDSENVTRPKFFAKSFFTPTTTLPPNPIVNDPVLEINTININSGYFTLRAENLHVGETYVIECWGRKGTSGTFALYPNFPGANMHSNINEGYDNYVGYRKLLFAGSSSMAQVYNLENTINETQIYEFYCVMYKKSDTGTKYTSNTHQCRFLLVTPSPPPPARATVVIENSLDPGRLAPPHNASLNIRLFNLDTTKRHIIKYFIRRINNSTGADTGYVQDTDLSDILNITHLPVGTSTYVPGLPQFLEPINYIRQETWLPHISFQLKPGVTTNSTGVAVMIYIKFAPEDNPSNETTTFGAVNGIGQVTVYNSLY